MPSTSSTLAVKGTVLDLSSPLVMGILNASPDSFSDGGLHRDLQARGRELIAEGADLLDVGGESGVTNRPAVSPEEEIARVVPVIEGLAPSITISVDTYKPAVAQAAIAAGASLVNDPSGLINHEVAEICAATGAGLVITHTRARPKQKLHNPQYDDVVDDVKRFLAEKMDEARAAGVAEDRLLLCPGPDMGKDPPQTVALLRRIEELRPLGRPLLLAVSRKDFVGALTERPPRERLGGTLAAIAHGIARGGRVLRVHDVAAVRDYLTVQAALAGEIEVDEDLRLVDDLRRQDVGSATAKEASG